MERRHGRHPDRNQALSIVAWSAASGLLLGLFADVLLVGVAVVIGSLAPSMADRVVNRPAQIFAVVALIAIPLTGAVLGYLEGRLKLR